MATASVSGSWFNTATWGGNPIPLPGEQIIVAPGVHLGIPDDSPDVEAGNYTASAILMLPDSWITVGKNSRFKVLGNVMVQGSSGNMSRILFDEGATLASDYTYFVNAASPIGGVGIELVGNHLNPCKIQANASFRLFHQQNSVYSNVTIVLQYVKLLTDMNDIMNVINTSWPVNGDIPTFSLTINDFDLNGFRLYKIADTIVYPNSRWIWNVHFDTITLDRGFFTEVTTYPMMHRGIIEIDTLNCNTFAFHFGNLTFRSNYLNSTPDVSTDMIIEVRHANLGGRLITIAGNDLTLPTDNAFNKAKVTLRNVQTISKSGVVFDLYFQNSIQILNIVNCVPFDDADFYFEQSSYTNTRVNFGDTMTPEFIDIHGDPIQNVVGHAIERIGSTIISDTEFITGSNGRPTSQLPFYRETYKKISGGPMVPRKTIDTSIQISHPGKARWKAGDGDYSPIGTEIPIVSPSVPFVGTFTLDVPEPSAASITLLQDMVADLDSKFKTLFRETEDVYFGDESGISGMICSQNATLEVRVELFKVINGMPISQGMLYVRSGIIVIANSFIPWKSITIDGHPRNLGHFPAGQYLLAVWVFQGGTQLCASPSGFATIPNNPTFISTSVVPS